MLVLLLGADAALRATLSAAVPFVAVWASRVSSVFPLLSERDVVRCCNLGTSPYRGGDLSDVRRPFGEPPFESRGSGRSVCS